MGVVYVSMGLNPSFVAIVMMSGGMSEHTTHAVPILLATTSAASAEGKLPVSIRALATLSVAPIEPHIRKITKYMNQPSANAKPKLAICFDSSTWNSAMTPSSIMSVVAMMPTNSTAKHAANRWKG